MGSSVVAVAAGEVEGEGRGLEQVTQEMAALLFDPDDEYAPTIVL